MKNGKESLCPKRAQGSAQKQRSRNSAADTPGAVALTTNGTAKRSRICKVTVAFGGPAAQLKPELGKPAGQSLEISAQCLSSSSSTAVKSAGRQPEDQEMDD